MATRARFVLVALSVLALALVLLALGWFPQEPVRAFLEGKLRAQLGPQARIGSLHVRPVRLEVRIDDLVVDAPGYRIEVPHAFARGGFGLLRGALHLRRFEADAPRLTIRADAPAAESSSSPVPTVRIEELAIRDGQLSYVSGDAQASLEGLTASGAVGQGTLRLTSRGGQAAVADRRLALGESVAQVSVSPSLDLRIESLEAATGKSHLTLAGLVRPTEDPELDLTWHARLDLAEARTIAGNGPAASGEMRFEGKLQGSLSTLRTTVDLEAGPARVADYAVERVAGKIEYDRRADEADAQMTAVLLGGRAEGRAHLSGGRVRATIHARDVQAAPARIAEAEVSAEGALNGQLDLKGRLRADARTTSAMGEVGAELEGWLRPQREEMALSWKAEATAATIAKPGAPSEETARLHAVGTASGFTPLTADATLSGRVRAVTRGNPLELPVEGSLRYRDGALESSLASKGSAGTLNAVVSARGSRLGRSSLTAEKLDLSLVPGLRGLLDLELHAEGPLDRLSGKGKAQVRELGYQGAELGELTAELALHEGEARLDLALPKLTATASAVTRVPGLDSAKVGVSLDHSPVAPLAPLVPGPPALDGFVTGRVEATIGQTRVDVHAVVREARIERGAVSVNAEAEVRVSGAPARPELAGEVVLRDVGWGEGAGRLLKLGEVRLVLEGDRLSIPRVEATLAEGTVHFEAAATLARTGATPTLGDLRLDAGWDHVGLGPLLQAMNSASDLQGDITGSLTFAGDPTAPQKARARAEIQGTTLHLQDVDVDVQPFRVELQDGRVSASGLHMSSAGGRFDGEGRADLVRRTVEARAKGRLELPALSAFVESMALRGAAEVDLSLSGTLDAPEPRGSVRLTDVTVHFQDFQQALTNLDGVIQLERTGVRIETLSGRLGGGAVTLSGGAALAGTSLGQIDVELKGQDVSLRHRSSGARARLDADLTLRGKPGALVLAGDVGVQRALYDTDIFLDEALWRPLPPPPEETSSLVAGIALDVSLTTKGLVIVRNNLADLQATGHLRVRGDLGQPAPFGRLEVRQGGKVFLQTREFTIDSGQLVYGGTWDPDIAIRAEGRIPQAGGDDVQVTVAVEGPLMKPKLTLSSDPSYSEREIASLIATGRRNVAIDSGAWVAGEQAAALLAGRLTRNLTRGLQEGLGLDEVTIQPSLLAREADPGVRFTFAKQFTPAWKLLYSVGLNDPEARFFEAQYRLRYGREITFKLLRDDEGTYSYGAGQKLRFGGVPRRARSRASRRVHLEDVRFVGDAPLEDEALRREVKARPGKRVSPWDLQEDAERLQRRLAEAGYLDALVESKTEGSAAVFEVQSGARYRWEVRGLSDPPDLTGEMRKALFAEEALERGRDRLLREARGRGFLRATVDASVEPNGDAATLVFEVDPGPRAEIAEIAFPGAAAISRKRLLEAAGGPAGLVAAPAEARRSLRDLYRREYLLAAEVDEPRIVESEGEGRATLRVTVAIREGERAKVAAARIEGASEGKGDELRRLAALEEGVPFDPEKLPPAVLRLRDDYLKRGYAAVRVTPRLLPADGNLEVVFQVEEGPRAHVGTVTIRGLQHTREAFVRKQVPIETGEPLDPRKLTAAEKRLLDLGIFSRVIASASSDDPADVTIEVEELGPYSVAYDLRYSQIDHLNGILDGELGNLWGRGLALGGRYRRGRTLQDARVSFTVPAGGRVGAFTAVLLRAEEEFDVVQELRLGLPAPAATRPEKEIRKGVEVQQTRHFGDRWDFVYGYRFQRTSSALTAFSQDVAALQLSLVRDTRDNPLDARRGRFWSTTVDLAPKALGSDLRFVRFFGQLFVSRGWKRDWTWAQGLRVGLANGLREGKQEEIELFGRSAELFRAGGANSLRGYATDSVGPPGPFPGLSAGGEAVILLNQELRYHHPSGLGAVFFYDGGNVFARVRDIDFDWRHTLGFGLRYESPFGLLRLDVAVPLNPRPGDRPYQWFISIGQAF